MNLSDDRATSGPLFSSVDTVQKSFVLTPLAGYRVLGSESSFVDVLGGVRFWHVNADLKFEPGILNGIEVSRSRNWLDGIFGLKGRTPISPAWSLIGYGDIGGGGSNLSYQLLGAAEGKLNTRFALVFGYRYVNVAYNKDGFLFDTAMSGPVFGVAIQF
jgi:hypothetical protein